MKTLKLGLIVLIFAMVSASCAPKLANVEGLLADDEVLLIVEGGSADSITMGEFRALKQKELTLTRTNSKGETTTAAYKGVQPAVLFDKIGVKEYSSITLTASDGYEQAYTKDVLEAPDALFAILQDGKPISKNAEDGQIWFCAGEGFTANYWAKYLAKITVLP